MFLLTADGVRDPVQSGSLSCSPTVSHLPQTGDVIKVNRQLT